MARDILVICEGKEGGDDELTLRALLPEELEDRFKFRPAGGQRQITEVLKTLPQFSEVSGGEFRTLAVVRDAEAVTGSMLKATRDALKSGGLSNVPTVSGEVLPGTPNIGVFIVGKADGTGMLEDLFLESVSGRPDFPCLEEYVACAETKGGRKPKNPAKAKLRAWLAMVSQWDLGAGYAVRDGLIDVGHPAFNEVRAFLTKLATV